MIEGAWLRNRVFSMITMRLQPFDLNLGCVQSKIQFILIESAWLLPFDAVSCGACLWSFPALRYVSWVCPKNWRSTFCASEMDDLGGSHLSAETLLDSELREYFAFPKLGSDLIAEDFGLSNNMVLSPVRRSGRVSPCCPNPRREKCQPR